MRLLLSPLGLFPFLTSLLTSFLLCYLLSPLSSTRLTCVCTLCVFSSSHSHQHSPLPSKCAVRKFFPPLRVFFVVVVAVVAGTRAPAPAPAAPALALCFCSRSHSSHSSQPVARQSRVITERGRLRGREHEGLLDFCLSGFFPFLTPGPGCQGKPEEPPGHSECATLS